MGTSASRLEKELGEQWPEGERLFGLENYGNTCYCNSVLQALYYCPSFRAHVLAHYSKRYKLKNDLPPQPQSQPQSQLQQAHDRQHQHQHQQHHHHHQPTHTISAPAPSASSNHTSSGGSNSSSSSSSTNNSNHNSGGGGGFWSFLFSDDSSGSSSSSSSSSSSRPSNGSAATVVASSHSKPEPATRVVPNNEGLLDMLCVLFNAIANNENRTGIIRPRGFVTMLRKQNEMFRGSMHQDAHEFLNYLLDTAADTLRDYQRTLKKIQAKHKWQQQMQQQLKALKSAAAVQAIDGAATDSTLNGNNKDTDDGASGDGSAALANGTVDLPPTPGDGNDDDELHDDPEEPSSQPEMGDADDEATADDDVVEVDFYENTVGGTFIHDVFEGQLVNEMKCFNCETISRTEETFLDLSVDVEQNTSLSACLKGFFGAELLRGSNKFYCDTCCSLQEASKRMRVKRLPKTLVIQLKRFKYIADGPEMDVMSSLAGMGAPKKLPYRVPFPLELRLPHSALLDESVPNTMYDLFAVVVHLGHGPLQGHYVAIVKSHEHWLMFDDENIEAIEKYRIQTFFGAANERSLQTSCGYLLFYQARTVDNALDQLSSPTKVSPRGTGTTAAAAAAAVPSHSQHMANGGVSSTARP